MGERNLRLALLRLSGEIGIKARATRGQFRRRLVQNLRDALAQDGLTPRLEISHDRLYAELPEGWQLEDSALTRVFGVQSVSLVERRPLLGLDEIVEAGAELFAPAVRGKRFAVRARHVGRREGRSATSTRAIERELGTLLLPEAAGVDLDHPEVTLGLELTEEATAFFSEDASGPGGLPLGVEGRAVALFSGGYDSAVAAWQISKRGVECEYLFCNLGAAQHLREVLPVARHLATRWSYGARPRLHVVDFEPVAEALRASTATRFWQVLLKRQMLRAAAALAQDLGASALVTGDAVGQVSSQTLPNLAVVSQASEMCVLRPLVGFDKQEITAKARAIGTYELSKHVGEYCAMVPSRPATRATRAQVEAQETKLPADLLAPLLATRNVFELQQIDPAALDAPSLGVEKLPKDAILLDLRPLPQYQSAHHAEALHLEFAQAMAAYPSFDRSKTYVLSCEYGLLSAQLAEHMHRAGLKAHHFRGGQKALMKLAKR